VSLEEFVRDARGQREQLRAERAARGEPILPPAKEWCVVAYRLEAAGFASGAAEAWGEALGIDPALPQAHLGLARALLGLGRGEDAAASCLRALEADGRARESGAEALLEDPDEDPWYCLGLAEHLRGRFGEAAAAYRRSAEAYPWFPEPMYELARAEAARGDRAAASEAARQALRRAKWRPEFAREVSALLADLEKA
jgi:tetratricopeptide (TPR) repeat protein